MGSFNPKFLAIKLYNFFFFGGFACFVPYLTPFGNFIGLNYADLGILWCIWPLVGMVGKPLIGKFADRLNAHRTVLIICVLITAGVQLALWWLPTIPQVPPVTFNFVCSGDGISTHKPLANDMPESTDYNFTYRKLEMCPGSSLRPASCTMNSTDINRLCAQQVDRIACSNMLSDSKLDSHVTFHLAPPLNINAGNRNRYEITFAKNYTVSYCRKENDADVFGGSCRAEACGHQHHKGIEWTSTAFWMLFLMVCVVRVSQGSAISLGDAMTFGLLARFKRDDAGSNKFTSSYGFQRSFGTLGWLVIALATGFFLEDWVRSKDIAKPCLSDVDQMYEESAFKDIWDFWPIFLGQTILFILAAVAACGLYSVSSADKKNSPPAEGEINRRKIGYLLFCDADAALFCLATVVNGMATGLLYAYLAQFMLHLKAPKYVIGIALAVETAAEFPIMLMSHAIIRAIGHHGAMTLALLSFCIRCVSFSFIEVCGYWWILLPELLHGLGFGLFYVNMAMFANNIAPPGASATVQGIIGGMYEGFGVGIGGLVSSFLISAKGFRTTWRWFGYFCGAAAIVYYVLATFAVRHKLRREKNQPNRRQNGYADDKNAAKTFPDENDGPYITMLERPAVNGNSEVPSRAGRQNYTPPSAFAAEQVSYKNSFDQSNSQRARMLATIEDLDEEDLRL